MLDNPMIQEKMRQKADRLSVIADPRYKAYTPQGSCSKVFYDKSSEIIMQGPSGTGKSRSILEKLNLLCCKYPGMRALMVRKTRESLTQSAMVTFEKFVMVENGTIKFRTAEQEYRYANGSVIALGGMDKASKVLSSEYDIIYAQEATELDEEDWETLLTRNRYGIVPYQQMIGDCNPSHPRHWLKLRIDARKIVNIKTDHEDNPVYWDKAMGEWTPRGVAYIAKLDALTGVRYKRLRLGLWAAAEGMIYDEWDSTKHLCNHFDPPKDWKRLWVVDFGFTRPLVWQAWAIDPDGICYRFAELYQTKLLVEDAAALIQVWRKNENEPFPDDIICDHDAEDRATLERHLQVPTTPANKDVLSGIQTVKEKLKVQGNGRAGIVFMRDSLIEVDSELTDAKLPTCTEEEIEAYEWDDKKKKEQPVKENDHGLDCLRYMAQYETDNSLNWSRGSMRR